MTLEEEMRRSYLDYAMSVIVARALPDARDGLKPVHRRILFGMQDAGYTPDRPYRKSARVVGDVMGKYHPHGDAAIYDAMVRMAQPFSMRVPLIDGQGNFGSVDGDTPAAMRYTEVRLARAACLLLADIDKDTVDFQPNYDETREGTEGPAGALSQSADQRRQRHRRRHGDQHPAAQSGRDHRRHAGADRRAGHIARRADADRAGAGFSDRRHHHRPLRHPRRRSRPAAAPSPSARAPRSRRSARDREAIIITEIPYQVNKTTLLERIGELVRDKQVEGIAEMRDESDRSGMRIVIELKRDATPEVVLNQLYRFTQLQITFGINMLALDGGRPRLMGLKDALQCFIAFREDVILRRAAVRAGQGARPRRICWSAWPSRSPTSTR